MVDRVANFQQQEIRFLDETITIEGRKLRERLPKDFEPDAWCVICGRGKDVYSHTGNKRLRVLVEANLAKYSSTKSKMQKTLIVSSIVDAVREASKNGGFVKQDPKTKMWEEVGDDMAREKVGQLLREYMTKKDPKKLQKRKEQRKRKAAKKATLVRGSSDETQSSVSDISVSSNDCASVVPSTDYKNSSNVSIVSLETAPTNSDEAFSTAVLGLQRVEETLPKDDANLEFPQLVTSKSWFDSSTLLEIDPLPIDANDTAVTFTLEDIKF